MMLQHAYTSHCCNVPVRSSASHLNVQVAAAIPRTANPDQPSHHRPSLGVQICFDDAVLRGNVRSGVRQPSFCAKWLIYTAVPANNCFIQMPRIGSSTATHLSSINVAQTRTVCRSLLHRFRSQFLFGFAPASSPQRLTVRRLVHQCEPFSVLAIRRSS